jgi:hypothetical protein
MLASRCIFLLALSAAPAPLLACSFMDPPKVVIASAVAESAHVFVGRVGRTTRLESTDDRFSSVLAADIKVLEVFKGELEVGEFVPMRLGQSAGNEGLAFAWEGDRLLVYALSLPVTEEDFSWCGPGTTKLGDDDSPGLVSPDLEILRELVRRMSGRADR